MKMYSNTIMVFLLLLGLTVTSGAAGSEWKLDTAHSGIYFEIDHIYAATRGYFKKYEGKIVFDPNDLNSSSFDFKVNVKSLDTGNNKRDGHIQNKEFFYSKKFPFMTFKSISIKHLEGKKYIVKGTMTVKDVSKDIDVPFMFFGIRPNPFEDNSEVAGFEARLKIDRLEYNVGNGKYYEMGTIGKDVDVLISFEALRKK